MLTELTREEAERALREELKNFDFKKSNERVLWSLNYPRCLCEPCYNGWLEWGQDVYEGETEQYKKRVAEEEKHRGQIRLSRSLDTRFLYRLTN